MKMEIHQNLQDAAKAVLKKGPSDKSLDKKQESFQMST